MRKKATIEYKSMSILLLLSFFCLLSIVALLWLFFRFIPLLEVRLQQRSQIHNTQKNNAHPHDFQKGVVFPRWSPEGYRTDSWLQGLQEIHKQTGARWIEMPILFEQDMQTSTLVTSGPAAPDISSFIAGIQAAHQMGYHIFVIPLISVRHEHPWAGKIHHHNYEQMHAWFESYWQTYQPYVKAAAQYGIEQLAIGTEYEWLDQHAPDDLWNTLITRIHTSFPGPITYDLNWTTISQPLRNWMRHPALTTLGVSAYVPLLDTPRVVGAEEISSLWRDRVGTALDRFAERVGKPILISEIGYRNSEDALYKPWDVTSIARADQQIQAEACDAALAYAMHNPSIRGIFFWGWDEVGLMRLRNQPAAGILQKWYAEHTEEIKTR